MSPGSGATAIAFDPAVGQQYAAPGTGQAGSRAQFIHRGGTNAISQTVLARHQPGVGAVAEQEVAARLA
ncbi:hypothetical protein G6F64_014912 [Rhizopus arrhizus]|uniref:Uncharacterized protein n=1 Tax=Rhizopus oryzae TaxID=64495 RepID=A0A9P7BJ59_RHIOR|nr:hypothetical protein G6F64_014912 [Rhizopus arrhizus]